MLIVAVPDSGRDGESDISQLTYEPILSRGAALSSNTITATLHASSSEDFKVGNQAQSRKAGCTILSIHAIRGMHFETRSSGSKRRRSLDRDLLHGDFHRASLRFDAAGIVQCLRYGKGAEP